MPHISEQLLIAISLVLLLTCQASIAGGYGGDFMGGAAQGVGEMGLMLQQQRQDEHQLEQQKELMREEERVREERRSQQEEQQRQATVNAQTEAEKTLDALQPDWKKIVASADFRDWMNTLSKDEKDRLNASWEPHYISEKITDFKRFAIGKKAMMDSSVMIDSQTKAKWVRVGGNNTSTLYADSKTRHRSGDRVKIWSMLDNTTPIEVFASKTSLSSKFQIEFDCKEDQQRKLALVVYSGNKGEGDVVYSDYQAEGWKPIVPDSPFDKASKFACGKK